MKTIDYLMSLPVGEVVGKRGLAYFKRKGFIWDYSRFGYLEGLRITGKKPDDSHYRDRIELEISKTSRCKLAEALDGAMYEKWRQTTARCEKSAEELNAMLSPANEFHYAGMTFGIKYLDGCLKPYLVKRSDHLQPARVNRRMAFPGGVI